MSDSSNISTEGNPLSNFSVGSISNIFTNNISKRKKNFRYRVTNLFFDKKGNCTHIEYEDTYQNYGQSGIYKTNSNSIAYTSNANIQIVPEIGEYIEIFNAAEEYSAAEDKSNPISKSYWKSTEGSLNIWNAFEGDNKNLDPTVPGQIADTQMASLNPINYDKSLIGMIPRQA